MAKQAAELISSILQGKANARIKLLGDSITHGVGGTGFSQSGEPIVTRFKRNPDGFCWARLFSERMSEKYSATVVNNACTGTKIEFVLEHLDTLVEEEDDLVICMIGTNNRHFYFKDGERPSVEEMMSAFCENIRLLVSRLRERGVPFVLMANIPASKQNEADGADFWRVLHMNDIRDAYAAMSEELDFAFVSIYDAFLDYIDKNGLELDSLLADGLHPNDEGYRVMFGLITEALEV